MHSSAETPHLEVPQDQERTLNAQFNASNICESLSQQLPQLAKATPLGLEILNSVRKNESRGLGYDMLRFDELYKTPIEITGSENIPEAGGCILASPHIQTIFWENRSTNMYWWTAGIARALQSRRGNPNFRPVAAGSLEKGNLADKIFEIYGGFPVRVDGSKPELSARSVVKATRALSAGDVVFIAPEGNFYAQLGPGKEGVAFMALRSKVPVIPLVFLEEKTPQGVYQYQIKFGEALHAENYATSPLQDRETQHRQRELFTNDVMKGIAKLLPENMRGNRYEE